MALGTFAIAIIVELAILVLAAWWLEAKCPRSRDQRRLWRVVVVAGFAVLALELAGAARWWDGGPAAAPAESASALPRMAAATPSAATEASLRVMVPESSIVPVAPAAPRLTASQWGMLVWLGGTMLLAGGLVLIHALLGHVRRRLLPVLDPVLESQVARLGAALGVRGPVRFGYREGAFTPYVFGLWRPTLVLPRNRPEGLTADHQEAVLIHELAHVAARDPLWQVLADVLTVLLWWHPGVWLIRSRLRRAAERSADDATAMVPHGPFHLAESLVAWMTTGQPVRWCAGLAAASRSRSWMASRVVRLIEGVAADTPRPWSARLRWWLRTSLPAFAAMTAIAGAGMARSHFVREDETMTPWKLIQGAVAGIAVMAATDNPASAQARIAGPADGTAAATTKSVAPAGKTEAASMMAVGLNKEQVKLFQKLEAERTEATKKFKAMPAGPEQREAGLKIGHQWRESLQELMTKEQYSRYLEYWETNNVVIRFEKKKEDGYTVTVAEHPIEANPKMLDSLKLSDEQLERIADLKAKLAKTLDAARKLAKTPDGLHDVSSIVAMMQRDRNVELKKIMSETQYAAYRAKLDEIIMASVNARKPGSGAARIAAPTKPK